MTNREILVEARRILTPDGACTQGAYARDEDGAALGPDAIGAVCWCLDTALGLAAPVGDGCVGAYGDAWAVLAERVVDPVVWNDAPGRTQAEVLGLLDRAIEREGEA